MRTYRMGFGAAPPRPDPTAVIPTIRAWAERADAAIVHDEVPWGYLLDGGDPAAHVRDQVLPLVDFYRDRGLVVAFTIDVTNGFARDRESEELRRRGRSVTEPAVRERYVAWAAAVARLVRPRWLGLAAETNLIRLAAPAPVYASIVAMAGAAAHAILGSPDPPLLYVSVQADQSWGRLVPVAPTPLGDDLRDFPWIDVLALSSYPYLAGFQEPGEVPLDYYSALRDEAGRPVLVVEGGWPSGTGATYQSSEEEQVAWLRRQAAILDRAAALAVFQLTYTDLDVDAWPRPVPEILPAFSQLGLVGIDYRPKPALQVWDSIFALPLEPEGG